MRLFIKKHHKSGGGKTRASAYNRGRTSVAGRDRKRIENRKNTRRKVAARKTRLKWAARFSIYIKWLIVGAIIYGGFNSLQIKTVNITSRGSILSNDYDVIQNLSDDYLSGLKRYKPFFNSADYKLYIIDKTQFVSTVQGDYGLLSSTLEVSVVRKAPILIYDDSSGIVKSQWIAQDGSLIELNKSQINELGISSPEVFLRDDSGIVYHDGETVISRDLIDYINDISVGLNEQNLEVIGFKLDDSLRQLTINLGNRGYQLIVATDREVGLTIKDLISLLKLKGSDTVRASSYIDLTVRGKAFYK